MSDLQRGDPASSSVPARFEEAVDRYPDRTAIRSASQELTYRVLNRAANGIAHAILRQCGEGESPVALLLNSGAPMVCAILAVLKAGKIYVPLDATHPRARIAAILRQTQGCLLVTDAANLPLAESLLENAGAAADGATGRPMNLSALPDDLPIENPGLTLAARRASAIYFTSGSTGVPKGVVRDHRIQLHQVAYYTRSYGIGPADRLALVVSPSVGMSDQIIFAALLNGASLHLFDARRDNGGGLAAWLRRASVTLYASTPTLYRELLAARADSGTFPAVRIVWLSGETVLKNDVALFRRHFAPGCILVNALGTVEAGDFRHFVLRSDDEFANPTVPAGYPVADKQVLLLDETGREVQPGQIGEIAVRSSYLALGYWRQPAMSAERFLADPAGGEQRTYLTGDLGRLREDGCLEHQGRADRQVKIRGFRIEPAEIEAALRNLAAIADAAVVARPDAKGDARLVAYVTPAGRARIDTIALRRELREILPEPMIPATFVALAKLPLTPTGKVDRDALPLPVISRSRPELDISYTGPASHLECTLAGIWADVLGLDGVGIQDDFTDLGGSSLDAMRILAQVLATCGEELPWADMFGCPTVAGMAVAILQHRAQRLLPEAFEQILAEVEALR